MTITLRDIDALDSVLRRADDDWATTTSRAAMVPKIFLPSRNGASTFAPSTPIFDGSSDSFGARPANWEAGHDNQTSVDSRTPESRWLSD